MKKLIVIFLILFCMSCYITQEHEIHRVAVDMSTFPHITQFEVSPNPVKIGEIFEISWTVLFADRIEITINNNVQIVDMIGSITQVADKLEIKIFITASNKHGYVEKPLHLGVVD